MYILIPIAGFAVTDSSAGGGELDVPSFQDFDVIHAVLVFELSPDHVREYFKSLVRVKAKAIMCLDPVLVDNSQTSKRFETIREVFWRHGERILCLKPVGRLTPSAFAVLSQLDFGHVG